MAAPKHRVNVNNSSDIFRQSIGEILGPSIGSSKNSSSIIKQLLRSSAQNVLFLVGYSQFHLNNLHYYTRVMDDAEIV